MKFTQQFPALLLAVSLMAGGASAQEILFQSSFDSDEGFSILESSDDTAFEFDYEYNSFDIIPEAPNSGLLSGEAFKGLKLEANISAVEASSIVAGTTGLDLSGRYKVQLDAWLNYNFPAGASGTTEFGGLSIGHTGVLNEPEEPNGREPFSGATFIYDTDGDSGSDFRFYKDDAFQVGNLGDEPTVEQQAQKDQYTHEFINNISEPYVSAFPGVDISEILDFIEGTTPDGSGGYRWMTIEAEVDTDAIGVGTTDDPGLATFTLTDAATGNSVEIGTIDNSNGNGVVSMTGDVAVVFADVFSSVSNDQELSFGMFDNLIVSRLEDVSDPLDCSGDGSVGSADVACATADTISATLEAASLLGGDLDLNGQVEFADFLTFSSNFGDASKGGVYANGDIDLDGSIAFADFLTLSSNFGQTFGAAQAQAVPEPQSLSLLLIGALAAAGYRRRR